MKTRQIPIRISVDTPDDPKYGGNNIYELLVRESFKISANNSLSTVHLDLLIEVEITDMPEIT
jgi:hypothetical protein